MDQCEAWKDRTELAEERPEGVWLRLGDPAIDGAARGLAQRSHPDREEETG